MARWWEHSPPTNVARVRFLDSALYVAWVCCWFSSLLREVFSLGTPVFPSPQKPTLLNSNSIRNAQTFDTWASGSGDGATPPHILELKINWFDLILILKSSLSQYKNSSWSAKDVKPYIENNLRYCWCKWKSHLVQGTNNRCTQRPVVERDSLMPAQRNPFHIKGKYLQVLLSL